MATTPPAESAVREPRRCWGVVPAAGLSRRMGVQKLLLPLRGQPVVAHLVAALQAGGVTDVHLLVRAEDRPLRERLASLPVRCHTVDQPTPDMRTSVERLLQHLAEECAPRPQDAWLLCPADHPVLSPSVVRTLLTAGEHHPDAILVPTYADRRGHPTLFPWTTTSALQSLPPGEGLNAILRRNLHPVIELPVDDPAILRDLDEPQDYQRLQREFEASP